MKLNKVISLNSWFSKSVNLERDSSTSEALSSYVPTSVSKRMLSSFFESQKKDKRLSRAWSLIGPYGSGKSSFALFLSGLLEDPASDLHKLACKKLQKFDDDLFKQHKKIIKNTNGYFNVLVTGSSEPIEEKLYKAIFESLEHSEIADKDKKKILKTKILEKRITSSNVVNLVKEIQVLLNSSINDYSGFVLIIDELGKFVEFAGRNRIEGDIYLLQQLAELSFEDNAVPFSLVVMLHQAIEYYAKDLDQKTKNEWRKIQGRFEEVSFSETVEQSVLIVKEAIQGEYSQSQKTKLKTLTRKALKPLLKQQAVPGNLDLSEAEELFTQCYPLHPITAIILPMLSQKLAQNERTLFSFLSSSQDFGFPSFLEQKNFEEYITTSDLFDYFIANQGSYISDHYTHRRWLEVQNALDRLGEAQSSQVNLIKTIGLLNIVGSMGGFKASLDLLSVIFEEKQLSKDIKVLEKKSLVSFRRFNDEYRIWQGSDFNLEQGLSHEMAQFEDFSLAKELNRLIPARPQIAKKSSITNHTLRYFRTSYLNESDLIAYEEEDSYPKIIYLLRDNNLKTNEFKGFVSRLSKNIILVSIDSSSGLENMCKELSAMKVILLSYPEIQSDPIAKKEVEDQILNLEEQISNRLNSALRDETSTWYHQGEFVDYKSTIDLQNKFSDIIDEIYPDSPIIANELLNRDVISGQAQRARTMLIQAMIEEDLLKKLALDNSKYPPEKTICEALLIKHNLVTFSSDGNLKFNSPGKKNDFSPLFTMLESTLRESKSPISFKEIQRKMSDPPFGIKEGLHPVIFMIFFMINRNKLAIYEDNQFKPYMDSEAIDRFVRTKTNSFAFQLYEFKGQAKLIDEYVKEFNIKKDKNESSSEVLSIARKLTKRMSHLPDFALSTRTLLSSEAQKFRNEFSLSRSPQDLLFTDIPRILQVSEDHDLSDKLHKVLTELESCYQTLLESQRDKLGESFNESTDSLNQLRARLVARFEGIEEQTIGLNKKFISLLCEEETEDQFWLEAILNFLVRKHPEKWKDEDISEAEINLKSYSDRAKDIQKLNAEKGKLTSQKSSDELDIYFLKSFKRGSEAEEEIVTVSKEDRSQVNDLSALIIDLIKKNKFKSKNDLLSVLAATVNDVMEGKNKTKLSVVEDTEES